MSTQTPITAATPDQFKSAIAVFRSDDWDGHGTTSVHLPRDIAEDLLLRSGWSAGLNEWRGTWTHPSTGAYTYDTAEALALALTAAVR